jgi:hypothetical protein
MIVHIEKPGANISVAVLVADDEVGAVAGAELVDVLNRWSAAYRAKTSESPGSTPMPTRASRPSASHSVARANCSSPSLTPTLAYGCSGWRLDRLIAMSR